MANFNSINDPDGKTNNSIHAMPLSATVIYTNINRDARLFGHLYYDWYEVDASSTRVGQKINEFGLNASYQWMFRVARDWRPFLGVGLGYGSETYSNRHTMTPTGLFSQTSYPERKLQSPKVLINTSSEWPLSQNWDMGVHLQFEQPVGKGSTVVRAGLYFIY